MPSSQLTPDEHFEMAQVPAEELVCPAARYTWWEFFAVVFAGSLASSIVIWLSAIRGIYGLEFSELSRLGHCFFLALGAFLGMVGSMLSGVIFLSISEWYRGTGLWVWRISMVASMLLSPLCSDLMAVFLSATVFSTIPDEWVRPLLDISDSIAP